MGDVITRFKLETTQYDSKLRDAAKNMAEFSRQASLAGDEFGKFANKNADAVRSLGNMATGSTNAKDKVKELVGAYNDLAREYNALTKIQQQSDFGKAMAESLTTLQGRIRDTKAEMQQLSQTVKQAGTGGGLDKLVGGVAGQFGMSASMFTGVGAAVAGFAALKKVVGDNIETAMNFERSMSGLSALTGMTGKDLDKLKEYAIELGSSTTLTASQVADAFRLIGSQQPQLLSSGEALKEVTKYAIQLSEAAGIDLATASQTLSTSINQMGGDSKNAARYVNVLAAASQKGAGDISWLGEALTKSATAAKAVGTDYEELVSNLEQLAKAGFDASTAGTALRSIIMNLEKQANQDFKPSVVGLTEAFDNLGKAQLDITGYQQIAGKMFATQAKVLADAASEARNMTDAITGTNIAEEQASTNVNNLSGAIKQLESAWEGLNLHINDSNGPITSFVNDLTTTVRQVDILATKIKGVIKDVPVIGSVLEAYGKYMAAFLNPGAAVGKLALDTFVGDPNKGNGGGQRQQMPNPLQSVVGQFKQTSSLDNRPVKNALKDIEDDSENTTKSIKELQAELKKLKALRDDAASTGDIKMRDQYNAQIKDINAQIKALRGGTTTPKVTVEKTEEQKNNALIAELTKEYQQLATASKTADDAQKAGLTERMTAIKTEIGGLQQRNEELKKFADEAAGKLKIDVEYTDGSLPKLTQELKALQDAQAKSANTEEWTKWQAEIDETTRKIAVLKGELPKGEQATFTVNVDKSQLEELKRSGLFGDKNIRVNIEQGTVGLPEVPTDDETIKVNVVPGKVELPEIPKEETVKVNVESGKELTAYGLPLTRSETYTLTIAADTTAAMEKVSDLVADIDHEEPVIKVNVESGKELTAYGLPLTGGETYTLTIAADTTAAMEKVSDLVADIDHEEPVIKPKVEMPTSIADMKINISDQLTAAAAKIDTNTLTSLLKVAVQNGITDLDPDFSELMEKIKLGDIPDATWQTLQDEINAKLEELGIEPIQIDFKTGNIKEIAKDAKKVDDGFRSAMDSVQNLGSALNNLEDPGAKVAGTVAQAIAQIALGFAQATTATAGAGPFAWIAAIAGGLATMTSTIAAIHNATGYAEGGVVKGPGGIDNVPAWLTAGEIVLNASQQNNLASALQSERPALGNLHLETSISAEDIRLVLNNRGKRTGRGEYVQGRIHNL